MNNNTQTLDNKLLTDTPCIRLCIMDHVSRTCKGCGRYMYEIANWSTYTDEDKDKINKRVKK